MKIVHSEHLRGRCAETGVNTVLNRAQRLRRPPWCRILWVFGPGSAGRGPGARVGPGSGVSSGPRARVGPGSGVSSGRGARVGPGSRGSRPGNQSEPTVTNLTVETPAFGYEPGARE